MLNQVVSAGKSLGVEYSSIGFTKSKNFIKLQLKALIARNVWRSTDGLSNELFQVLNQEDKAVQEAIKSVDKAKDSKSFAHVKVSRSEALVEVGQNVSQIRTSKSVLAAGISKSVVAVEIMNKVSQGASSPNVSQVISPNVSEVVRSTVSKVDGQIELEGKNSVSQNNKKFQVVQNREI